MESTQMEFRPIRPDELNAWAEFCARTFGDQESRYFLNHFLDDPFRDYSGVFVAVAGTRICASARVFTRRVYLGGTEVSMGGIGEVCTDPDFRRMGLSGKLLAMCIEYMNSRRLAVSMLFTGRYGHYARYGWQRAARPLIKIALCARAGENARAADAQSLGMEKMRALYCQANRGLCGVIVRDTAYWDSWLKADADRARALYLDGQLVGYINAKVESGVLCVNDAALLPQSLGALGALLRAAAPDPSVQAAVLPRAVCPPGEGEPQQEDSLMVRLNFPIELAGEAITDTPALIRFGREDWTFWNADGF